MALVTLTQVKNEDKVSAQGNDYVRCSIKVAGKWYSGFGNDETKRWRAGQQVDVSLWDEEFNGKTYGKFEVLPPNPLEERIERIEKNLSTIIKFLKDKFPELSGSKAAPAPTAQTNIAKEAEEIFSEATPPATPKSEVADDLPWE